MLTPTIKTLLACCFFACAIHSSLIAQEFGEDQHVTLLLNGSSSDKMSGFIRDYAFDTLWISQFKSINTPDRHILSVPVSNLQAIQYPSGIKKKGNFLTGALIGAGVGLIVAVASYEPCDQNQGLITTVCQGGNGIIFVGTTLGGGLVGGLIGSAFRSDRLIYATIPINGRPENLHAEREKLKQLMHH